MPSVPITLKNRIKRHLGYNRPRAVNPSTIATLDTHLDSILENDDIYSMNGPSIVNLLNRCDELWELTNPLSSKVFSQFQQIIGDVNRQTRTVTINDVLKSNREAYYLATDDLSYFVNVPNLQRPRNAQYLFTNLGSAYVLAPSGAADTCVSDRLWLSLNAA
jgi:hypothetical protein